MLTGGIDIKAILKYPGAKWRISDWIISHFPEHKVYLEPFFGSGACFFNKEPAYIETINDLDGDIVNLFSVCREHPQELAQLINLTPFARDEFKKCYRSFDNPIEQARRTLVRYHQSFGTSNSSKNSWRNVQTYGGPRCATMWNDLPEIILQVCGRLKNAQIENTDALTLIERYNDNNTLIYCDPPYLRTLRKKNMYAVEMDDKKHIELLSILKRKPVVGHKFSIGATDGEKIVGVCIVGRPVSRYLDDGMTLEVTRCATDGTRNACSILYAAAWRAARAWATRR